MVSMVCVGVTLAGAGLTGCGGDEKDPHEGTNGVAKLTAPQIQLKSRAAARSAPGVRLSGTLVVKGQSYRLDMRLSDEGGTGSVTSKNSTFRLLRIGEQLYLEADSSFWTHGKDGVEAAPSDVAAAEKLTGKFVKVPEGDPSYQQLSGFTDMDLLLDGLLTLHGKVDKGEWGTAGGVKSIRLTGDQGSRRHPRRGAGGRSVPAAPGAGRGRGHDQAQRLGPGRPAPQAQGHGGRGLRPGAAVLVTTPPVSPRTGLTYKATYKTHAAGPR